MLALPLSRTLTRNSVPKGPVGFGLAMLIGSSIYLGAVTVATVHASGTATSGLPAVFGLSVIVWFLFRIASDLGRSRSVGSIWQDIPSIVSSALQWGGLLLGPLLISGVHTDQVFFIYGLVLLSIPSRILTRIAAPLVVRSIGLARPSCLLIVGSGQIGQLVAASIIRYEGSGATIRGFVDDETYSAGSRQVLGLPLYRVADITHLIEAQGVNRVVFAFSFMPDSSLVKVMRICRAYREVRIDLIPRFFETMSPHTRLMDMHGLPLLHVPTNVWRPDLAIKSIFDRIFAGVGLLITLPLVLLAILAVRLEGTGPTFFKQTRVGQNNKLFTMYKLRSMRAVLPGEDPDDSRRYTGVGAFLRKWSIDELPQLWNVLRGDMSLVGPRPEREEYVKLFSEQIPDYGLRHRMRGGLTGLAQVKGLRGDTSIVERVRLDRFYVETWNFWLDLRIIFMTFTALIARRQGIGGPSMFLDLVTEVASSRALDPLSRSTEPRDGMDWEPEFVPQAVTAPSMG